MYWNLACRSEGQHISNASPPSSPTMERPTSLLLPACAAERHGQAMTSLRLNVVTMNMNTKLPDKAAIQLLLVSVRTKKSAARCHIYYASFTQSWELVGPELSVLLCYKCLPFINAATKDACV